MNEKDLLVWLIASPYRVGDTVFIDDLERMGYEYGESVWSIIKLLSQLKNDGLIEVMKPEGLNTALQIISHIVAFGKLTGLNSEEFKILVKHFEMMRELFGYRDEGIDNIEPLSRYAGVFISLTTALTKVQKLIEVRDEVSPEIFERVYKPIREEVRNLVLQTSPIVDVIERILAPLKTFYERGIENYFLFTGITYYEIVEYLNQFIIASSNRMKEIIEAVDVKNLSSIIDAVKQEFTSEPEFMEKLERLGKSIKLIEFFYAGIQ